MKLAKKIMNSDFNKFVLGSYKGRLIGLDVGSKTIGVSVSDVSQMIASGVTVINRTSLKRDLEAFQKVVSDFSPCAVVFGWPVQTNGEVGEQCKKVQNFIDEIKNIFNGPLIPWDERFSSKITDSVLIEADVSRKKRDKVIDKVAAIYILQGALDFIANRRRFLLNNQENADEL